MQTSAPSSLPASLVETLSGADSLAAIPLWLRLVIGVLLIGVTASKLTADLRATFPPATDPKAIKWHFMYPSLLGAAIATLVPFTLPTVDWRSRWLVGIVSTVIWYPLYEIVKKRTRLNFGVTLPPASDMVRAGSGGAAPTASPTPTEGTNS